MHYLSRIALGAAGGLLCTAASTAALIAPVSAAPPLLVRMPARSLMALPRAARSDAAQAPHRQALSAAEGAHFTIVDAPGAGTASGQGTTTYDINSSSVVTGEYFDSGNDAHGFLRTPDGTYTTFDVDGAQTVPNRINDRGAVVGTYIDPNTGIWDGFLRTAGGKIEAFDPEGNAGDLFVSGINRKGETTGFYSDASGVTHSFLRQRDGTLTEFDAPGAVSGTEAEGINDEGTIVGGYADASGVYHGFIRAVDGTFSEFDAPSGTRDDFPGPGTLAASVNKKGWIAGVYIDASNVWHGFARDPGGTITAFDAPDAGKGTDQGTAAVEINSRDRITGWYLDSSSVYHGFVREKDGSIKEFDAPGAGTGPGLGTLGLAINRYNVISGWDQDDNGVYHGFLRVP